MYHSPCTEDEIKQLRDLLDAARGNRVFPYPKNADTQPWSLARLGFAVCQAESINVMGEDTNYWSITRAGIAELKRIDTFNGQEKQESDWE